MCIYYVCVFVCVCCVSLCVQCNGHFIFTVLVFLYISFSPSPRQGGHVDGSHTRRVCPFRLYTKKWRHPNESVTFNYGIFCSISRDQWLFADNLSHITGDKSLLKTDLLYFSFSKFAHIQYFYDFISHRQLHFDDGNRAKWTIDFDIHIWIMWRHIECPSTLYRNRRYEKSE